MEDIRGRKDQDRIVVIMTAETIAVCGFGKRSSRDMEKDRGRKRCPFYLF